MADLEIKSEEHQPSPRERAEHWANTGVPFAAEFFGKEAGLEEIDLQKLVIKSHQKAAEISAKIAHNDKSSISWGADSPRHLFNDPDMQRGRDAVNSFAIGKGRQSSSDAYLGQSFDVLRIKIRRINNREADLSAAHTEVAAYLVKKYGIEEG